MRILALILTLVSLSTGSLAACSVPVFRYALERWPEDPHLVTAPATAQPDQQAFESAALNIWIDPSAADDQAQVIFPDNETLWYEGPWTPETVPGLIDSPMRRRIASELIGGTTATFVYLPGAKETDHNLAAIRSSLKQLQDEVSLPQEDPIYDEMDPSSRLGSEIPMTVAFGLHELDPADPHEAGFIHQLQALDTSYDPSGGPLLIAIYGRGRAFALFDDGLDHAVLEELAWFLVGACSCQVKALNPGTDLLLACPWDEALYDYPNPQRVALPGIEPFELTPVLGSLDPLSAPTLPEEAIVAPPTPVPPTSPAPSLPGATSGTISASTTTTTTLDPLMLIAIAAGACLIIGGIAYIVIIRD